MKYEYKLIINQGSECKRHYAYSYSGTKNIVLHIRSGSAMLSFTQTVKRDPEAILSGNDLLCSDAIKKAMLVHLILYGAPLDIRQLQLSVNGKTNDVYNRAVSKLPLVYSMVERKTDHPLPEAWQNPAVISRILNTAKSAYDGRNNALIALLIGKSKLYESEKSLYLWMAVNGFYGFFTEIGKKTDEDDGNTQNKKQKKKSGKGLEEWKEHKLFRRMLGMEDIAGRLDDSEKTALRLDAMSLLKKCTASPEQFYDDVAADRDTVYTSELKEILNRYQLQTGLYTFMTMWLPYQIRCGYFHNSAAMPVFSYREEKLLKALTYTNYFVERMVEERLPEWLAMKDIPENMQKSVSAMYKELKKI